MNGTVYNASSIKLKIYPILKKIEKESIWLQKRIRSTKEKDIETIRLSLILGSIDFWDTKKIKKTSLWLDKLYGIN